MPKKIKRISLIIALSLGILFISNISNAGDLKLNELNYQVQLNADGSADVVENWNIKIKDTNTLFKTFKVDTSKYKAITEVEVSLINGNARRAFTQIKEEQYHVDENCYYALKNKKGDFEIAWGVNENNAIRNYEIKYKIEGAVKNYQDCSEFYWQFIGKDSAIPAKVVKGTITLPNSVVNQEDLKVWAHGPLNGNIKIESADMVAFEVENLRSGTMLEARIVTPTSVFSTNTNTKTQNKLDSILQQEQKWADEANLQREQEVANEGRLKIIRLVFQVVGIVLGIFLIFKIIKYHKELKKVPIPKPEQEMQYYREIPKESYTPAQAAFLYYFKAGGIQNNIPNIVSATMLDLCMKNYLSFEIIADKKDSIRITLKPNKNKQLLQEDERIVYTILEGVAEEASNSFTMKDFEKYVKKNARTLLSKFSTIASVTEEIETQNGTYDKKAIEQSTKWSGKCIFYIFLTVLGIFMMQFAIIPAAIASVSCFTLAGRFNRLTQKGANLKEEWTALKRYMEDFSMINDKEVPELILWEKYLVFATAFGIADKVLKQLKVVYPQITDANYMNGHGYAFLYLMYSGMNTSFINSLNNSVSSTYNSINYSSGSGGGGGFSGGGGFGGGGGRNRRKIIKKAQ